MAAHGRDLPFHPAPPEGAAEVPLDEGVEGHAEGVGGGGDPDEDQYDREHLLARAERPGLTEADRAHGDDRLEHGVEQAHAEADIADRPGHQDYQQPGKPDEQPALPRQPPRSGHWGRDRCRHVCIVRRPRRAGQSGSGKLPAVAWAKQQPQNDRDRAGQTGELSSSSWCAAGRRRGPGGSAGTDPPGTCLARRALRYQQ